MGVVSHVTEKINYLKWNWHAFIKGVRPVKSWVKRFKPLWTRPAPLQNSRNPFPKGIKIHLNIKEYKLVHQFLRLWQFLCCSEQFVIKTNRKFVVMNLDSSVSTDKIHWRGILTTRQHINLSIPRKVTSLALFKSSIRINSYDIQFLIS